MVDQAYIDKCLGRMQVWMGLRGLRANTVSTYLRCARRFMIDAGKRLGEIKRNDIETYLLDFAHSGRSARTRNVNLAAICCVLRAALRRDPSLGIPQAKVGHRVPDILSGTEVKNLLAATGSLKYRAIFMVAYGAGLRVSEITSLHTTDIDGQRMLIRVREGKTGQRYVMMSPLVLAALRAYWKNAATRSGIVSGRPRQEARDRPFPRSHQPRAGSGGAQGGDHQTGIAAHAAALFCHAPSGNRRGHTHGASSPGACEIAACGRAWCAQGDAAGTHLQPGRQVRPQPRSGHAP